MKLETIMCNLFNFSIATYYKRKREQTLAIKLIEESFSKEELSFYLNNQNVPYKIQFANKYFSELNDAFTNYLLQSPGLKALMFALLYKKEKHSFGENYFPTLNDVIFQKYEDKSINRYDLIDYFDNQPSEELLLYILENYRQDWKPYLASIENSKKWLVMYFEILELSIKKGCYDSIFKYVGNIDTKVYNYSAIPKAPISKNVYNKDNNIFKNYENILINVKELLIDGKVESLEVFPNNVEFNQKMEPLKDKVTNEIIPLKNAFEYLSENDEGYQQYLMSVTKQTIS